MGARAEEDAPGDALRYEPAVPSHSDWEPSSERSREMLLRRAIPDELLLSSQSSAGGACEDAVVEDAAGPVLANPADSEVGEGDSPGDSPGEAAPLERVSAFHRKGRPNRLLMEAMQEALAEMPSSMNSSRPQGGERMPGCSAAAPEVGQLATREMRAQRKELVQRAKVDLSSRSGLLKRPFQGLCPPPQVAEVVQAAARLGELPGEPKDDEAYAICGKLLSGQPLPLASKPCARRVWASRKRSSSL